MEYIVRNLQTDHLELCFNLKDIKEFISEELECDGVEKDHFIIHALDGTRYKVEEFKVELIEIKKRGRPSKGGN